MNDCIIRRLKFGLRNFATFRCTLLRLLVLTLLSYFDDDIAAVIDRLQFLISAL